MGAARKCFDSRINQGGINYLTQDAEVSNQFSYHIIAVLIVSCNHKDMTTFISYKITTVNNHTMRYITKTGLSFNSLRLRLLLRFFQQLIMFV